MHNNRRIYEIISISYFAHGWRLEKFMSFKTCSFAVFTAWSNDYRCFQNCQHIRSQNSSHGTGSGFVTPTTKSGVEISFVPLCQKAWIKLRLISFLLAQSGSVRIMYITIKFIFSSWRIAHRYRNDIYMIQHIIQIISAIRTYRHIRGKQTHFPISVQRI